MQRKVKVLTEAEQAERREQAEHKAQLTNHKEAKMPLAKLKAKISKELSLLPKVHDFRDIMVRCGFHAGTDSDGHSTVSRVHTVRVCGWPKHSKYDFSDADRIEYTIHVSESIPLADYWRLALSGRGI